MEATEEEIRRFMSFVDKLPNGCWFWTGARSRGGGRRKGLKGRGKWYGTFRFRGKAVRAHKFACDYIGHFKPLPPGHHRDHLCEFSLCVRMEHFEQVTHEENEHRKKNRKRRFTSSPADITVHD